MTYFLIHDSIFFHFINNEQFFFNGKLSVLIFRTWVLFVEGLQKKKVEHVSTQPTHIQCTIPVGGVIAHIHVGGVISC